MKLKEKLVQDAVRIFYNSLVYSAPQDPIHDRDFKFYVSQSYLAGFAKAKELCSIRCEDFGEAYPNLDTVGEGEVE